MSTEINPQIIINCSRNNPQVLFTAMSVQHTTAYYSTACQLRPTFERELSDSDSIEVESGFWLSARTRIKSPTPSTHVLRRNGSEATAIRRSSSRSHLSGCVLRFDFIKAANWRRLKWTGSYAMRLQDMSPCHTIGAIQTTAGHVWLLALIWRRVIGLWSSGNSSHVNEKSGPCPVIYQEKLLAVNRFHWPCSEKEVRYLDAHLDTASFLQRNWSEKKTTGFSNPVNLWGMKNVCRLFLLGNGLSVDGECVLFHACLLHFLDGTYCAV